MTSDNVIGTAEIMFPTSFCISKIGRNAATVVSIAASTGGNILCAPRRAASL